MNHTIVNFFGILIIFISIPPSHNLSATHLLASPDGSRYLLEHSNGLLPKTMYVHI